MVQLDTLYWAQGNERGGHTNSVSSVASSPDNRWVISGSGLGRSTSQDGINRFFGR